MSKFKPGDDAILIAASNLAAALASLRHGEMANPEPGAEFDYSKQEQRMTTLLAWSIDQVKREVENR